jgi:hypothetical protein
MKVWPFSTFWSGVIRLVDKWRRLFNELFGKAKMINLIKSLEHSLNTENHYASLVMALTMPDICGWIESPLMYSKERYINWYEKYLKNKYTRSANEHMPEHIFLSGADCYALRCALLHEGRENISTQKAGNILDSFQFVVPPSGWTVHQNQINNTLQLQVDIFCQDIIAGVKAFLVEITDNIEAQSRMNQALIIRNIQGVPI